VAGYERAWRSPGTDALAEVFTPDVTYLVSPWAEPLVGLERLGPWWEGARDGPDEAFTMRSEVVAVEGDTAVVRVAVDYEPPRRPWRDLWVLRFDATGRCTAFEEWPYAPDSDDGQH
jgi:ketosteroid isomerase-like protein